MARGVALTGLSLACSGTDSSSVQLQVYNWWTEPSEQAAFQRVVGIHHDHYPNVEIQNEADPQAKVSRTAAAERILAGVPPATFQANIGADLLRWTVVDSVSVDDGTPHQKSMVQSLDGLYAELGLAAVLPEPLRAALRPTPSGSYYGVPIDIHRLNVLYYNVDRLDEFTRKHQSSFLDIHTLCPDDPANTPKLDAAIGIGTDASWTLVLLAFENILPALTGGDFYDDLWHGRSPAPLSGSGDYSVEVERALRCVKYLSQSFVDNHGALNWAQAASLVADGQAAFTVMGDWADGVLGGALESGRVARYVFPNTDGLFVFTSDIFPLPIGAPYPAESAAFLRTIGSSQAQLEYSAAKGSIPARSDVDVSSLSSRQQTSADDFQHARPLLATSGLCPPAFPLDTLGSGMDQLAASDGVERVLAQFRDAYPVLTRWQERLSQGAAPPGP